MQSGVLFVNMQYQRRIGGRRGYGADSSPVGAEVDGGRCDDRAALFHAASLPEAAKAQGPGGLPVPLPGDQPPPVKTRPLF